MRKFGEIYKEKLNEASDQQESKILKDFKSIYSVMLEHYGIVSVHDLDPKTERSFLTELNKYWSEDGGLTKSGKEFLKDRRFTLNENSTSNQKKIFLKNKSKIMLNEIMRQTNLKFKLYNIIDEMYNQISASNLTDVLPADSIVDIIKESFSESLTKFFGNIRHELRDSSKKKLNEDTGLPNTLKDHFEDIWNSLSLFVALQDKGYLADNGSIKGGVSYEDINNFLEDENLGGTFTSNEDVEDWIHKILSHLGFKKIIN